jgi:hypothetical protein
MAFKNFYPCGLFDMANETILVLHLIDRVWRYFGAFRGDLSADEIQLMATATAFVKSPREFAQSEFSMPAARDSHQVCSGASGGFLAAGSFVDLVRASVPRRWFELRLLRSIATHVRSIHSLFA